MDELDKKLFDDLSKNDEVPIRCEFIIRNALNKEKKKKSLSIKNILLITARVCGVLFITSGVVFATTKIYENIWKDPKKIDSFYGESGEYNEDEEYGIWHTKDIDISNKNAITENEAKIKFNDILKKFGYENEIIKSIELIDNPSDDSLFYRATTENKFLLDLDAKDTRNFKIFTDVAYKDIDKYRGTQDEIENIVNAFCEKYGYDLSKYNHKEISFNISQTAYEKNLYKHIEEENPNDANIWQVKYNKEYNGIVNRYEEITIGVIPEINELYYFIYTDKSPENTDIVIKAQEAKDIALAKENVLNIGYNIKNIETELDIVKMNGYAYLRENNFEKYYEQTHTPKYPISQIQYYRVEERIRQVWRVKLEFKKSKDFSYQEDSFTYFVDVTTGEIVGGE